MQLNADDGSVTINTNLNVPNGFMKIDSIRARVIHVGDSSITIGNFPAFPGANNIFTNNGTLRIQSNAANNFSTIINSGVTAGVGIGNVFPQTKLHIHQDDVSSVHQPVYALFTNEINGFVIPSTTDFNSAGFSYNMN